MVGPKSIMNVTYSTLTAVIVHMAGELVVVVQGTAQDHGRFQHCARCGRGLGDRNQTPLQHERRNRHEHDCSGEPAEAKKRPMLHIS
jgi:hypothetical protein